LQAIPLLVDQPKAAAATLTAGEGLTRIKVTLNYLRGFSMRPLSK
jgi:hypothetical protein